LSKIVCDFLATI